MSSNNLQIGIISDTHGHLHKKISDIFSSVDHIIHAGDIGNKDILFSLQLLAPVTAVYGNSDDFSVRSLLKENETLTLLGYHFCIRHIGTNPVANNLINSQERQIFINGHTHVALIKQFDSTSYINPGAAVITMRNKKASVAMLHLSENNAKAEIIYL